MDSATEGAKSRDLARKGPIGTPDGGWEAARGLWACAALRAGCRIADAVAICDPRVTAESAMQLTLRCAHVAGTAH